MNRKIKLCKSSFNVLLKANVSYINLETCAHHAVQVSCKTQSSLSVALGWNFHYVDIPFFLMS